MGLLDTAIPDDLQRKITDIMARHARHGVRFHALRTRQAGAWRFIDFHVLVPGTGRCSGGTTCWRRSRRKCGSAVPNSSVFTHLEPIEDPASFADVRLERDGRTPGDRRPSSASQLLSLAACGRSGQPSTSHTSHLALLRPAASTCARSPAPSTASSSRSGAPMHGSSARL